MKILAIIFIISLNSCQFVCSLNDDERLMIKEANAKFNSYCDIENIPCETFYLNIRLKKEENSEITSQIHKILYDEKEKNGWLSLHLYDANGKFLLTHHANGKTSTIAPNW